MEELCRRFQESFGETNLPEELIRHAASCSACREFRQRQEALMAVLPSWETPETPPDFALAVMSRVAEEAERKPDMNEWFSGLFRIRLSIPFPVGALACALFIASLFLNLFFWTQPEAPGNNTPIQVVHTPAGIPTPRNMRMVNSPLAIPREWTGAGAFLLIPMFDLNTPLMETEEEQDSQLNDDVNKI